MNEFRAWYRRVVHRLSGAALALFAWMVTGVRPIWLGSQPSERQRIYFANHSSHGDMILVSSCLPPAERMRTRAVAAADYWGKTKLRRFIAEDLLSSVLIERQWVQATEHPVDVMLRVLEQGDSLIIFPEGTRNTEQDKPLLRFRSGLYNIARARPDIELIPCWIENMSRVLPKGEFLPVPLLCRVIFGEPVALQPDEERAAFLERTYNALLELNPKARREA